MKLNLSLIIAVTLISSIAGQAFADCASEKNQAVGIIQNLKSAAAGNSAQANALSEQLAKHVDNLSSQSCNSELLDVYRTMQREGIQAN